MKKTLTYQCFLLSCKRVLTICIVILITNTSFGQLQNLGLNKKVIAPPNNRITPDYNPKCKIIGDSLYVSTNTGIYVKNLLEMEEDNWELYAFDSIPIIDFSKNGDKLLAISPGTINANDSLLFYSGDNGKTHSNITPDHFFQSEWRNYNYISQLAQNPQNPNTLLAMSSSLGISKSNDFGQTWEILSNERCSDKRFFKIHPLDTLSLYVGGGLAILYTCFINSFDYGKTWMESHYPTDGVMAYDLAFHPTDPNIIITSGGGLYINSSDKGLSWKIIPGKYREFIFSILFDERNPEIIYGVDLREVPIRNQINIYRSTDTGESWHEFYGGEIKKEEWDQICNAVLYKNKIIVYTYNSGLYAIDLDAVAASIPENNIIPIINVYPNPADLEIQFDSPETVISIDIMDLSGKVIKKLQQTESENRIDVSGISNGIYFLVFHTAKQTVTKKIVVMH